MQNNLSLKLLAGVANSLRIPLNTRGILLGESLSKSFPRKRESRLSRIVGLMDSRLRGNDRLDQAIPGCMSSGAVRRFNIITLLAMFMVLVFTGDAYCATAKSKIQYIESDGLSFEQLVEKISLQTGYEIELVGEWPNIPVEVSLEGVSLEAGLKRIFKQLGDVSHILIFDDEQKKLKIVRLKAGVMPDKGILGVSETVVGDDNINPTPGSGEHGLTQDQLAAIKAEYHESIRNQSGDAELLPTSEYGPALTQAEFDLMQEQYNLMLESEGVNHYVLPPSADDNGLTISDFESIKKSYYELRESAGPAEQVLPDSEYGPGLTQGELDAIKKAHSLEPISSDTMVSPPSSQGPGITLGELEEIKRAYQERQKAGLPSDN